MKRQRRKRCMLLMESLMISMLLISACGGSSSQGDRAAANNPALVTETSTSGTEASASETEASTSETEPSMSESGTPSQESTTEAEGKDDASVETMTLKKETEGDDSKESSKSIEPVVTVYTEQDLKEQGLIVYTDPEAHEVVYNKDTGESMRFISGELIEHGIESISLPAVMFESDQDAVPISDPDFEQSSLKDGIVYDLSPLETLKCTSIATKDYRFFSTTYRVESEIDMDSAVLEVAPLFISIDYRFRRMLDNLDYYTVVQHPDGTKDYLLYGMLLNKTVDELSDDKGNVHIDWNSYVGTLVRPRGKQIQVIYFGAAMGSPGYQDNKLIEYVLLHSIKFTERLESTLRFIPMESFEQVLQNNPKVDLDLIFPERQ